jgi:hypothetical protein
MDKPKTPSKQRWKFTKDTIDKAQNRPKYRNDKVHEPAEVYYEPYTYKPTAVESWLGFPEEPEEE